MKLSRRFLPHQLLSGIAFLTLFASAGFAQDRIVLKGGKVQQGQVVGVVGPMIKFKVGSGVIDLPISTVTELQMAPPPQFEEGRAAMQGGEFQKAFAAIKNVAEKFKGLPTDWAQQATAMMGDLYLELGDPAKAEAAYKEFQKLYPGAQVSSKRADVGMARLALTKKDYPAARAKLESITSGALKTLNVSNADSAIYGQAFYLLGQVDEAEGKFSEALQNYLRTVAIFPHDPVAAQNAQQKADALRKAQPVLIP